MIRFIFFVFVIGLFLGFPEIAAFAVEPTSYVAIVKVSSVAEPEECYRLLRDGKPVKPLSHDMRVMNNDEIIPVKGKDVKLIYIHTGCGEQEVNKKTKVNCNPAEYKSAGGFLSVLKDNASRFLDQKVKRKELLATKNITLRGIQDISCFPAQPFIVSPWPLEGSTVLSGEPIFFRWQGIDVSSCTPARLVIKTTGVMPKRNIVENIRIGALVEVKAPLKAGKSYEWFVETQDGNKIVSDKYHFIVLSAEESDNIRNQLAEVKAEFSSNSPNIAQALYLQLISDATPGLNLYADSLRFLEEHNDEHAIPGEVVDRLYKKCLETER